MFDIHRVELDWGGRKLTLETGRMARQADGAVLATYGETTVLATAVAAKNPREGVDFLPLTVDYQEKYYAAGRIPGGYFKREGRPTEKETLVSRLIDRPIRPLFAEGWRCETQVIVTTLSHDLENDPDILALVASSAALTLSGAPFMGPIGAARVGFINNEYVLNPQLDEMTESQLDLVVAGTSDAVLMVESEAKELVRRHHAGRGDVRPPAFPAGDRGHHQARRKGRQGAARTDAARQRRPGKGNPRPGRAGPAQGLFDPAEAGAPERRRRLQGKGDGALLPRGRREPGIRQAAHRRGVQGARSQDRALERPRHQQAHRRPRPLHRASDRRRSGRAAARTWLGAVHPRRDPGAGRDHAGHRRGRAMDRRLAGQLQGILPAAL